MYVLLLVCSGGLQQATLFLGGSAKLVSFHRFDNTQK